jgi:hypothetical protein
MDFSGISFFGHLRIYQDSLFVKFVTSGLSSEIINLIFSEIKNEKNLGRRYRSDFAIKLNGAKNGKFHSIRQSADWHAKNGTHFSGRDRAVRRGSAFARYRPAAA